MENQFAKTLVNFITDKFIDLCIMWLHFHTYLK